MLAKYKLINSGLVISNSKYTIVKSKKQVI
jgi:hypothetical protein